MAPLHQKLAKPYYQHQSLVERHHNHDFKYNLNRIINQTGAPASCWLLC